MLSTNNLVEIKNKYKDYINDPDCVYKSCDKVYIVVLKKLTDTNTNESRDVADINYAKFRADKLLVVNIIAKFDISQKIDKTCNSVYKNTRVEYKIGEIVSVNNFETNLSVVCAPGIHYFKTIEPAFYYEIDENNIDTYCSWYDTGAKRSERKCETIDDQCRKYTITLFFENGHKESECTYENEKVIAKFIFHCDGYKFNVDGICAKYWKQQII